MSEFDGLAAGWQVWNEGESEVVLVYRPDVFNAREFPAACLPTIYVTQGRRSRRPGTEPRSRSGDSWYVAFFLEPEVGRDAETYDDRAAAIAATRELAERFARGELDYRSLYQVAREGYLDRLDELTSREE